MALENGEVLQNLTQQLQEVTQQLNTLGETRVKLIGAIEVLQQIEETNNPSLISCLRTTANKISQRIPTAKVTAYIGIKYTAPIHILVIKVLFVYPTKLIKI